MLKVTDPLVHDVYQHHSETDWGTKIVVEVIVIKKREKKVRKTGEEMGGTEQSVVPLGR